MIFFSLLEKLTVTSSQSTVSSVGYCLFSLVEYKTIEFCICGPLDGASTWRISGSFVCYNHRDPSLFIWIIKVNIAGSCEKNGLLLRSSII